ncbi:MAG: hypothetical protein K9M99_03395 [Candidatus Cloacimonetes bacterium]|nr:hypothetical protein [Candidatus Cloacimonadota bacterium]
MISMDWKERLRRDSDDFFKNKIPVGFYDIEIVYNAYPLRINNKIPNEVIAFVGKKIASKIADQPTEYIKFYDYLFDHKGETGKILFAYIITRALQKSPDIFFPYLEKKLFTLKDAKLAVLIVDKAICPLVRKEPTKYQNIIISWAKIDHPSLTLSMQKIITSIMQTHPENIPEIFHHLESGWLNAGEPVIKMNIAVMKSIYKINPDFYYKIYGHYQNTREPIFAEILTGAIMDYHPDIETAVTHWSQSGNTRLKKYGMHALKLINKKRKNK